MPKIPGVIARKLFVNSDGKDSCQLFAFCFRLAIGHVTYANGNYILQEDKTIYFDLGDGLERFLDYVTEAFILKHRNSEEISELSLCDQKIKVCRDTKNEPIVSISKIISGKDDVPIVKVFSKTDLFHFMFAIRSIFLHCFVETHDEQCIIEQFIQSLRCHHGNLSPINFQNLPRENKYIVIDDVISKEKFCASKREEFLTLILTSLNEISMYFILYRFKFVGNSSNNKQKRKLNDSNSGEQNDDTSMPSTSKNQAPLPSEIFGLDACELERIAARL